MKSKSRGLGNKASNLKPFPNTPLTRNIKLRFETYGKLRDLKNRYNYPDFNSLVEHLMARARGKQ